MRTKVHCEKNDETPGTGWVVLFHKVRSQKFDITKAQRMDSESAKNDEISQENYNLLIAEGSVWKGLFNQRLDMGHCANSV